MIDDDKAADWVRPVDRITAEVTAVGCESRVYDDGAVDADVLYDGDYVGCATLIEDPALEPESAVWGVNVDVQPDLQLQQWLDGRDGFHAAITAAIREARERAVTR